MALITTNAQSTYGTELRVYDAESQKYKKLMDIADYPDLGSEPDLIDVSVLGVNRHLNIFGPQGSDSLPFSGWLKPEEFVNTLLPLMDQQIHSFELAFGVEKSGESPTYTKGHELHVYWDGMFNARITGAAFGEAAGVEVSITTSSDFVFSLEAKEHDAIAIALNLAADRKIYAMK